MTIVSPNQLSSYFVNRPTYDRHHRLLRERGFNTASESFKKRVAFSCISSVEQAALIKPEQFPHMLVTLSSKRVSIRIGEEG